MKKILFISLALFSFILTKAQQSINGLYINEKSNEFVYLFKDSIQFNLCSYDAFASYSYCLARYKIKNKNRFIIGNNTYTGSETSVIKSVARKDSLISIKLLYQDNSPILGATVCIKDKNATNSDCKVQTFTDSTGIVVFNDSQISKIQSKELLLDVNIVGFQTTKDVILNKGNEYIIKSLVPLDMSLYTFKGNEILIKEISSNEIEVKMLWKKRHKKRYGSSRLYKAEAFEAPINLFELK